MSGLLATLALRSDAEALHDVDLQRFRAAAARLGHRGSAIEAELGERMGRVAVLSHPENSDGIAKQGPITAALAGRFDEPEELAASLGLPSQTSAPALLAAAYARWGEAVAGRVQGEYVFLLWNAASRRGLAVRDRFGICPLYMIRTADRLHLASEIKALAALQPEAAAALNEGAICDYVALGSLINEHETLYADIQRLPPAHHLVLGTNDPKPRRYYDLAAAVRERQARHEADPAGFRPLFEQAVRRRLSKNETWCRLSGGLDSSSIAVAAEQEAARGGLPAPGTMSLVFDPRVGPDERCHIEAVRARLSGPHRWVCGSEAAAFSDFDAILDELDAPPEGPNVAISRFATRTGGASRAVILCGHGGDEVVDHGTFHLDQLARHGHWMQLLQELGPPGTGTERWRLFRTFFIRHAAAAAPLRLAQRKGSAALRRLRNRPADRRAEFLASAMRSSRVMRERYRADPTPEPDLDGLDPASAAQIALLRLPVVASGLEELDHERAASGHLYRYPFFDRDLVEFCVSRRGHEKWSRGYGRWLMRAGMVDLLPDEVRLRGDKFNFYPHFNHSLRLGDGFRFVHARLEDPTGTLSRYVNIDLARTLAQRLQDDVERLDGEGRTFVWRAIALGRFLERRAEQTTGD